MVGGVAVVVAVAVVSGMRDGGRSGMEWNGGNGSNVAIVLNRMVNGMVVVWGDSQAAEVWRGRPLAH